MSEKEILKKINDSEIELLEYIYTFVTYNSLPKVLDEIERIKKEERHIEL